MTAHATTFDRFADALADAFPRLSPQQQLIAQYVMEHPDDFALATAAAVAKAAAVQPSALVRFANALGYAGFSDLQQVFRSRLLHRAGSYRDRIDAMRRQAAQPTARSTVLHQFVDAGIAELHQLAHDVRPADLQRGVELVCRARRVRVLAQRRAFPVAAYLAYALAQLDLKVQLLDGVGGMLDESLRQLEGDELLVVASFKNYSPQVIAAAERAAASGTPVLAITDHALSPLKPHARVCFEVGQGPGAGFRSLVSPLCLAQTLVVSAGHRLVAPRASQRASPPRVAGARRSAANGSARRKHGA